MISQTVEIGNNFVSAKIESLGAELQVLKCNDGKNILWKKDDVYWNRVAPNLFPIVGRLLNDCYVLDGEVYEMKQHGFARDQYFEILEQDESSVLLGLKSTQQTMAVYPFAFSFQVRYRLDERVLWIDYITKNLGEKEMLYSVGGHPGFALPGVLEVHSLAFSQAGERKGFSAERRLIEGGYYSGKTEWIDVPSGVLALSDSLFEQDAMVFHEPSFDSVTLLDAQGAALLDFYCWEWDAVGFWTKPGAPFFCIEPWWGWADEMGSSGQFVEKAGLRKLAAGAEETVGYGIGLP